MFPKKMEMNIVSQSKEGNGILFEGTKGNLFVSRGKLTGPSVDELKEKPLSAQTCLRCLQRARRPPIIWKTSLSA
jgi:hypothetical protein